MDIKEFKNIVKNGRIFTVTFIKKDGTRRILNGRVGVHKYVTGQGQSYNPESKGLVTVYDVKNYGYRMVNVSSIKKLKANGRIYKQN